MLPLMEHSRAASPRVGTTLSWERDAVRAPNSPRGALSTRCPGLAGGAHGEGASSTALLPTFRLLVGLVCLQLGGTAAFGGEVTSFGPTGPASPPCMCTVFQQT